MMLSAHFSLEELTRTDTGLPNEPAVEQGEALVILADTILEPMRRIVGPLEPKSGFRCPAVNAKVGGAKNSQHLEGKAADVVPLRMPLEQAFQAVKASSIPFDQLIIEPGWLHVSWSEKPRRQTLRAYRKGGRMVYEVA